MYNQMCILGRQIVGKIGCKDNNHQAFCAYKQSELWARVKGRRIPQVKIVQLYTWVRKKDTRRVDKRSDTKMDVSAEIWIYACWWGLILADNEWNCRRSHWNKRRKDGGKPWGEHLQSRALEEKAARAIEVGNVRKGCFFTPKSENLSKS